jgi:DNA-binding transcriptional MerR regulator
MTTSTETFTVGEAAARTGFSIDTLRYYERLGLVAGVDRTAGGRRRYTAGDLGWLELVSCLRGTGMPVREMQRFAELIRAGDDNLADRQTLLLAHRDRVNAHVAELQQQLRQIQHKIDYYAQQQRET